jgi:hypothetical protein
MRSKTNIKGYISMPQLDIMTFMPQFVWLTLIFLTFYNLILQVFLPKISTNLKIRKHKVKQNDSQILSLKDEESNILSSYDSLVKEGITESRRVFTTAIDLSGQWMQSSLTNTNAKDLKNTNIEYIQTLAEMKAKKYLVCKA